MVAIIDYGMGNVISVQKALKVLNAESIITDNAEEIEKCSHIILPGVGSFRQAMDNLHKRGLVKILNKEVNQNKKPFLGICLGMQLLADRSFEDSETIGLGYISGTVKAIPATGLPTTHIGWNNIEVKKLQLFKNVNDHNFYFVHGFCFCVVNENDIAATVDYGTAIVAAVQKDNIYGTQFHPEKSQVEGIAVLKNFLN